MEYTLQRYAKGVFLAAFALLFTFAVVPEVQAQQTIDVPAGTNNIADALENQASSGDIIRLTTDGGTYTDTTLFIDKDITIKAQAGLTTPPNLVFDASGNSDVQIQIDNPATQVKFVNFTMGRTAGDNTDQPRNMIQNTADQNRIDLTIQGMELRNVANKMLANENDADPAVYDSLVIKRTYAHHAGNNVFDLKANSTPNNDVLTANYVQLENVTIAQTTDQTSAIGFMTKGGLASTDSLELQVDHVTMDEIKIGFNINDTPTDCSDSEIKNTIITQTQDASKPAVRWNGQCNFTVDHMVTYNTGGFGGGNIGSTNSLQWSSLNYQDPSTGNYALQAGVPGTAGNQPATDGDDRGDLRGYDEDARLPVELTSFEAVRDGQSMQLRWRTASEVNNAHFDVLRDAGDGWQEIGRRMGAGTTSQPQSYTLKDDALPFTADVVHYRLRQVDLDGTATLSAPLTVELNAQDEASLKGIAPNPVQSSTTIRYSLADDARVTVAVFDALGRSVATLVDGEQQGPGPKLVPFDATGLASGTYFVRVTAGDRVVGTKKMMLVQ